MMPAPTAWRRVDEGRGVDADPDDEDGQGDERREHRRRGAGR